MTSLVVLMGGEPCGEVTRRAGGRLTFRYQDGYRGTPLSVAMPTQIPEHPDRVIAPWLAGLLPDNPAVISRWSRQFQVAATPFALLGTPVGHDCAGAVQFAAPGAAEDLRARPGGVEWLTSAEVADRLRALRRDSTAWLGTDPTGQFSLAGAQSKIALRHRDDRWGIPLGASPTSHILKPAVEGLDDHDLNEHLCLRAARLLGLPAADSRIERFEDERAIVVARYDRIAPDGELIRVHQEDLCQALSVPPTSKYQNEGGPGARRIVELLGAVMAPDRAHGDIWRFIDALIFNWLIAGTDAHAKNYSLLLSGSQVRLAPLYDIASALPYPGMHERQIHFAMKLGRGYEVWPHHDPWPKVAIEVGVDGQQLRSRVDNLSAGIADAFADAAREAAPDTIAGAMPALLTDRIAERVGRCRTVMGLGAAHRPG